MYIGRKTLLRTQISDQRSQMRRSREDATLFTVQTSVQTSYYIFVAYSFPLFDSLFRKLWVDIQPQEKKKYLSLFALPAWRSFFFFLHSGMWTSNDEESWGVKCKKRDASYETSIQI